MVLAGRREAAPGRSRRVAVVQIWQVRPGPEESVSLLLLLHSSALRRCGHAVSRLVQFVLHESEPKRGSGGDGQQHCYPAPPSEGMQN